MLVTAYLVVAVVVQSPAGKLGDLFGHRRALLTGQLFFAVGVTLGSLARSVPLLTAARR